MVWLTVGREGYCPSCCLQNLLPGCTFLPMSPLSVHLSVEATEWTFESNFICSCFIIPGVTFWYELITQPFKLKPFHNSVSVLHCILCWQWQLIIWHTKPIIWVTITRLGMKPCLVLDGHTPPIWRTVPWQKSSGQNKWKRKPTIMYVTKKAKTVSRHARDWKYIVLLFWKEPI